MLRPLLILIISCLLCCSVLAQQHGDPALTKVPPISAPVVCAKDAKPAMLLVEGVNSDPEKFKRYSDALKQAEIYEQLDGYYMTVGDPVELLEGEWPQERFTVIARFPCRERAHQFWYSDTYAKIKDLRQGAGEVRAMVYQEFAVPDRITWGAAQ